MCIEYIILIWSVLSPSSKGGTGVDGWMRRPLLTSLLNFPSTRNMAQNKMTEDMKRRALECVIHEWMSETNDAHSQLSRASELNARIEARAEMLYKDNIELASRLGELQNELHLGLDSLRYARRMADSLYDLVMQIFRTEPGMKEKYQWYFYSAMGLSMGRAILASDETRTEFLNGTGVMEIADIMMMIQRDDEVSTEEALMEEESEDDSDDEVQFVRTVIDLTNE